MSDCPTATRRAELAGFLRSRRVALKPEIVGIERGGRRHTPGLRREEVAELAGIGVGWYTWLEQGRPINVSPAVLWRLARALRLNTEESNYMLRLADKLPSITEPATINLSPALISMLRGIVFPCTIFDARMDRVAFNALAGKLYGTDREDKRYRNLMWRLFNDPAMARTIVNRDEVARNIVGVFRTIYVQYDPAFFVDLFAELERSDEFCALWADTNVSRALSSAIHVRLPDGRDLHLNSIRLNQPDLPGYTIVIHSPANDEAAAILDELR